MSSFTTPAILEMLGSYKWRLVEPFEYYTDVVDGMQFFNREQHKIEREYALLSDGRRWPYKPIIRVPVGTVTDLASVPRLLWAIFPPNGQYAKAAIVHDYLYSNAIGDKSWADNVFREAMGVLKVPKWRRITMYWAVRLFGRGAYKR